MKNSIRSMGNWILIGSLVAGASACHDSSSGGGNNSAACLDGTVTAVSGQAVSGATVYLVPADMIDLTPITASGVLAGTTEGFDEPLEDLIASAGASFTQSTTDVDGAYQIDVVPDGRFYLARLCLVPYPFGAGRLPALEPKGAEGGCLTAPSAGGGSSRPAAPCVGAGIVIE